MPHFEVESDREFLCRLETGSDWRAEIEGVADAENIDAGWFVALGAVQDAELWFYDQTDREYQSVTFDEPLEVASCIGNISRLDGERFAHTHAVCSRRSGQAVAGHLDAGTVFAGEAWIRAFETPLDREPHAETGLDLWG
jgi:predicted DNA-binding protein with PD1-like motif